MNWLGMKVIESRWLTEPGSPIVRWFPCGGGWNVKRMVIPQVPYRGAVQINASTHVIVELEDVRAADSVRLSYDFDRDGWKIEQASTFEWDMDDEVCDPDWQEVAFVKAWAREKPTDAR